VKRVLINLLGAVFALLHTVDDGLVAAAEVGLELKPGAMQHSSDGA
jgi:hypothetical protein